MVMCKVLEYVSEDDIDLEIVFECLLSIVDEVVFYVI